MAIEASIMERSEYEVIKKIQDRHWLWHGQGKIICNLIEKHIRPGYPLKIADVGCGFGFYMRLLSSYGEVTGLEADDEALSYVTEQYLSDEDKRRINVLKWMAPARLDLRFDLVTLIYVLEHIEDESQMVEWIYEHLNPHGHAIIIVPSYQFLWTQMDDLTHHERRYTRNSLYGVFKEKFEVSFFSYYNFFLFPCKLAFVILDRLQNLLFPKIPKCSYNNVPPFNETFKRIISLEAAFIGQHRSFPLGATMVLLAKKRS